MNTNYGNQLAVRESGPGAAKWLKVGAIASLLLLGAAGFYFILNPHDPADTVMGFVSLGLALALFFGLFALAKGRHSVVTIYEEGVVIKRGKKVRQLHFSEITGLIDSPDAGLVVPVAGGIIGGIVIGAASALAANALDAHRSNNRLRSVYIIPANPTGRLDSMGISVVNTAGDELSQAYTEWLIKTKNITEENVRWLQIPFGEVLRVDNGAFVLENRRGEERFEFERFTDINFSEESVLFYGIDDNGKNKCLIDAKIAHTHNLDLLFYVYGLVCGGDEDGESEES